MRKKTKFKYRILSFLIMALMMLNVLATPTGVLAAEIYEAIAASQKVSDAPTSLDDIKIPTVSKNPYDVNVYVETYPIYNDAIYNRLNSYTNAVNGYEIHRIQPEGHSPYYTASIGSWYDYQFWKDGYDDMQITSNLPYREGRDSIFKYESGRNSQMLHSELTLKNGGITVRPINDLSSLSYSSYKEILTDYITNNVGLNKDQVYLRASTMLLSGKGGIWATYVGDENDSYSTSARADADGAKRLSLDVPLSRATTWTTIYFDADSYYNEPDSIMTDFSLTLIDNTAPQVSSITVEREVREDYSADLILTMKFNEKIRFANEDVKNELDNIWVELELLDLSSGKKDTVRLYLEKLENGSLVFRGDIGLYNYKNFRVNRIKKANLPNEWRSISIGVIDLADEMYKGAYETVDYNNEIITVDVIDSLDLKATTTPICDLAGNAINTASITNWSFGDQSYISNTFEAVDVKLYNQNTIGLALGEETEGEAERADMIVGPSSELYVYVYLNQHLTKEEAEKVYIELNILDENGNPVKARATSSSDYTVDEMYADGTLTGTVLKFENIKFKQGMSLDLEEGEDVEPLIKVAKMTDEIDGKTAYANVVEPSRKMYADFTPPEVTYEYYAMNTEEPDYTASISISVEDIVNYSQIAGLLGTTAYVSIGGGVEKDTRVKYILTENAIPPEEKSGYTNELTLKKNAMSPIGTFTILNATTKTYLHLLIESDELFIDDLFIAVEAEDIVGNISEIDPPETIEYMVDEIAPETEYVTQSAQVLNQNTQIEMSWSVYAHDRNNIDRFLYYFGDEYTGAEGEAAPEWLPLVITPGNEAEAVIKKTYGGLGEGSDVIHTDTLWIKAIDEYGNESEPIAKYITVSLEKPSTNAKFEGDITAVSDHHKITVTGADPALLDGADAYTRVTLTPIDNKEYSYVTLVKTGETVDVLSFKGRTWYRVKLGTDSYTEVSAGEIVTDDYTLTEDSVLYGLFTYYGDLKVSFENGYGDMTPRVGFVYDMANVGSYAYDPNYFVVRYASPYNKDITVNNIDFGNIIDKDGSVVIPDADYGKSPYKYNASRKGINPMRNSQIHFTVSNAIRSDYGILDFDYESSYMEFIRAGENGEDDVVVSKQTGLAASASQYYSIPSYTDSGESFITGAYYLRVTLLSKNGSVNIHESSRVVLDAQTADNAGVWKYSYQTRYNLEAVTSDTYSWVDKIAEGEPFDTIGVSVSIGGEKMRSSVFAVYSYGV
ncbi:MAG: hypothetical protein IJZ93_06925 [Clostridia bacterium]|nr:hypothetical protein [Clostridia bacterium]